MLNILVMFTYMPVMFSYRLLLSAMHYNENADRPQATTPARSIQVQIRFPKGALTPNSFGAFFFFTVFFFTLYSFYSFTLLVQFFWTGVNTLFALGERSK